MLATLGNHFVHINMVVLEVRLPDKEEGRQYVSLLLHQALLEIKRCRKSGRHRCSEGIGIQ